MKHLQNQNIEDFIDAFEAQNFQYPYENSLGYIMESANIDKKYIQYFKNKVNRDIQFHLFLGDPERRIWNQDWNLYIPKRFSST